ncbi:haloacid dehalogenase [Mucilaginibacter sp. PPCGB 2223]|uniref:HAD-IIB family hydrolase n=1 Tax=Mucilaginibacter sp. PPCGB 2223 TaxID=1886027 RepID=UPI0008240AEE|nr:HAD-IIB family hydrolase [Mucilaginibacter sp. PPCGB 2223]OCX54001.1 haloacid dehalogenase [Mucilaginibacter sp. PPCGB 2223]
MRYHVFTTDYDGTLAVNDRVSAESVRSLIRLKATGRKLVLVTGRELDELKNVFPEHRLFDRIVAENGALIYRPATLEIKLLGQLPPVDFIDSLRSKNVPVSVGRVIVATHEPYHATVLETIKEKGLEYQVIFNKGAVMILPPGINKATGLHEALREMSTCAHNTIAIGDAENDNAMLQFAECAVAVNNALSQVKEAADWITEPSYGEGVQQLIAALINDDLCNLDIKMTRHYLKIGEEMDGSPFLISPYDNRILLAGTSGFGKSTLAAALLEKLIVKQYQFCVIDPEGDYLDFPDVVTVGNSVQPPVITEVLRLLHQAEENVVVCILAIPFNDRPAFFAKLMNEIFILRAHTGHPHFLVLDEAHHLIPKENCSTFYNFPEDLNNFMAITTRPSLLNIDFLKRMNLAMTMGELPDKTMHSFTMLVGEEADIPKGLVFQKGDVLVWQKQKGSPRLVRSDMPGQLMMRHKRKYAAGDMGNNSFYFKGPSCKLNLKANNLLIFIQMAAGVDDETWLYHLHRHDYSKWFRNSVKNELLAERTERIENREQGADCSRQAIFKLILEDYTAAA